MIKRGGGAGVALYGIWYSYIYIMHLDQKKTMRKGGGRGIGINQMHVINE
jgi:hypothetical protein